MLISDIKRGIKEDKLLFASTGSIGTVSHGCGQFLAKNFLSDGFSIGKVLLCVNSYLNNPNILGYL
jgi:hypothetical protein